MKNRKTITNYEWRQHAAVLKFRFWTLKVYAKTRPFVIQLSVFRIFFPVLLIARVKWNEAFGTQSCIP